jgi:hypothetical protein
MVICTAVGGDGKLGMFWNLVGKLIPGEVTHCCIYLGPERLCCEAGPGGVVLFELEGAGGNLTSRASCVYPVCSSEGSGWKPHPAPSYQWDAREMLWQRYGLLDRFVGVADLITGPRREWAKSYCLRQVGKSYNYNFWNTGTQRRFYCAQLVYQMAQDVGVDIPKWHGVVLPQTIYDLWRCEMKEDVVQQAINLDQVYLEEIDGGHLLTDPKTLRTYIVRDGETVRGKLTEVRER